jgi:hypothetical protein
MTFKRILNKLYTLDILECVITVNSEGLLLIVYSFGT